MKSDPTIVNSISGCQLRRILAEPDFFKFIFDALPLQIVVKSTREDSFGQFLLWNRVAADWLGLGEARGKTDHDFLPRAQADFFLARDREIVALRQPLDIPEELISPRTRDQRSLHTIKTPIFDENGAPLALLAVSEDITARLHSEAAAAQAAEMRRQITSCVPGAIYQLRVGLDGRRTFTFVSERMAEIFGISTSELLADADAAYRCVHQADVAQLQAASDRARDSSSALQCTFRIHRRDGALQWLEINAHPQPQPDGTVWFGFITDITARRQAEEALRESEERWNLALAGTEAGVWDWNVRSGDLFYSERWQRMFGYLPDSLPKTTRQLLELVHREDRATVRARTLALLRRRSDLFRCEYRMRRSDGAYLWILAHAKAHFDSHGRASRMIGTLIDITERKRVEDQLLEAKTAAENASRAKGEFLAMMSHEIRTPLNGALGFAELLAATPLDARQTEFLQTIRESGSNLLHVLNDILDYSKIEFGKLSFDSQPASLRELVASATETFRAKAAAKQLNLICKVAPDAPAIVIVDALRLRQVLTNLISNAVKFTPAGTVQVRVDPIPDAAPPAGRASLRFSVIDSGIGIVQQDLPRLFEPFEQLDLSMARRFGGTGLGLAIVHRLVEMMGGKISATSQPDQGTIFTVDLTIPIQSQLDSAATSPGPPPAHEGHPLSILLVDDHAVNRRLARLMLQRLGHLPCEAASGEEAVELASRTNYDVIFMDIQMPGMDGYEAARRIRKFSPLTRIVALTAHALPSDRKRSAESGMQAHLTKPVHSDDLRAVLAECTTSASQSSGTD